MSLRNGGLSAVEADRDEAEIIEFLLIEERLLARIEGLPVAVSADLIALVTIAHRRILRRLFGPAGGEALRSPREDDRVARPQSLAA